MGLPSAGRPAAQRRSRPAAHRRAGSRLRAFSRAEVDAHAGAAAICPAVSSSSSRSAARSCSSRRCSCSTSPRKESAVHRQRDRRRHRSAPRASSRSRCSSSSRSCRSCAGSAIGSASWTRSRRQRRALCRSSPTTSFELTSRCDRWNSCQQAILLGTWFGLLHAFDADHSGDDRRARRPGSLVVAGWLRACAGRWVTPLRSWLIAGRRARRRAHALLDWSTYAEFLVCAARCSPSACRRCSQRALAADSAGRARHAATAGCGSRALPRSIGIRTLHGRGRDQLADGLAARRRGLRGRARSAAARARSTGAVAGSLYLVCFSLGVARRCALVRASVRSCSRAARPRPSARLGARVSGRRRRRQR